MMTTCDVRDTVKLREGDKCDDRSVKREELTNTQLAETVC